jgi:hypothetical protein
MKSCIYEGTIRHRRFRPRPNHFQYRIFFLFLDLAELDTVFADHPLWSVGRVNAAYLRRRDHFGDPHTSIDRSVRDLVARRLGEEPEGPIRMLTHLRYWGHCFNPATFYYIYDRNDRRVETIVVEIHNTPWGERHCYVLGASDNLHPQPRWRRHRFAKAFHVSPFIDMDIRYDWRFRIPGEGLQIHMIDEQDGQRLFDATLTLRRRAISRSALTKALIKYPFMTLKVSAMIYFQALRLTLKKVPFFTHPRKRRVQQERTSP